MIWLHWMEFLPTVTDKYCLLYIKVYSVFYKLRFRIFAERIPEIECPEPRLTKLFDPEPVNFSDFCCISFCLNNGTLVTIIKKLLQFCRNYLGLVQFDNSFHVSWVWADANLDNIYLYVVYVLTSYQSGHFHFQLKNNRKCREWGTWLRKTNFCPYASFRLINYELHSFCFLA